MAIRPKPIRGLDRRTGRPLSGWPRCQQAIEVILTTRLRTRVMRLWFGSSIMDMIDKPAMQEVFARGILATIKAIHRFEPEYRVRSVSIDELGPSGRCVITVEGIYLPEQANRLFQVTLLDTRAA